MQPLALPVPGIEPPARPAAPDGAQDLTSRQESQHIVLRSQGRTRFVAIPQIRWVNADRNYVDVHVGGECIRVRERIERFEAAVGPEFMRIHRSTLVRLAEVQAIAIHGGGRYEAVLHDGTRLRVARTYRSALETALIA